jgi:ABC-type thiamine transport system ATPase subunit
MENYGIVLQRIALKRPLIKTAIGKDPIQLSDETFAALVSRWPWMHVQKLSYRRNINYRFDTA